MNMDYTLSPQEYRKLKGQLTRAINAKDHNHTIRVCDEAFKIFEAKGYPDSWSNWERAKHDAEFHLQHSRDRFSSW